MIATREAVIVRGAINSVEALCVVASLTGDVDASVEREIAYPYFCFDADCSLPTLAGRRPLRMVCLVDAVNGLGATADGFELEKRSLQSADLMASEIDDDEAAAIAERTVSHRLGRRLRTIASFDVSLSSRGLVYKRFWIVRSGDARVMVDSTTGGLHPLKLRVA